MLKSDLDSQKKFGLKKYLERKLEGDIFLPVCVIGKQGSGKTNLIMLLKSKLEDEQTETRIFMSRPLSDVPKEAFYNYVVEWMNYPSSKRNLWLFLDDLSFVLPGAMDKLTRYVLQNYTMIRHTTGAKRIGFVVVIHDVTAIAPFLRSATLFFITKIGEQTRQNLKKYLKIVIPRDYMVLRQRRRDIALLYDADINGFFIVKNIPLVLSS